MDFLKRIDETEVHFCLVDFVAASQLYLQEGHQYVGSLNLLLSLTLARMARELPKKEVSVAMCWLWIESKLAHHLASDVERIAAGLFCFRGTR